MDDQTNGFDNSSQSNSVSTQQETAVDEPKDYIHFYESDSEKFPPPPPPEHLQIPVYDFEQESTASTNSEVEKKQKTVVKSIASMGDLVVEQVQRLSTQEDENEVRTINDIDGNAPDSDCFLFIKHESKPDSSPVAQYNGESDANAALPDQHSDPKIVLFIKAGSDRECIGCCPFSQRLFMMLWLKGVVFNVTTVDKATKPKQLKDIAAGTNPPFLLFNGEELTDIQKCEDYIEAVLHPPRYPKLACRHAQSNSIGNDVFAKFSAFVKFKGNKNDPKRKTLETKLNDSLRKFDKYLNEPLDDEIDEGDDSDEVQTSKRKFIDGDQMTIADCNMLPKLNMIRVAGKDILQYDIPPEFTGIARYLANADEAPEFSETCPHPGEIVWTYGGRKPRPGGWKK